MRKIIVSNYVSLDGFFAGPNGEIDWFVWDEETEGYAIKLAASIDTILFGRVTYELMAGYWPTVATENPVITDYMNNTPKIVFSRSLNKADWRNTRILKEIDPQEIRNLKGQAGKDLVIYGSGRLVATLAQAGLIDDYRIFVNPVVLGNGKHLFAGLQERLKLKLLSTKTFRCGVVLLHYGLETK
ncbi:MAG: dihydrofolate reductase family protein [Deltaproteobacteria bacterium]|nr:dihydrofolate reductase family protein [Deltaproteobacteria bacterium]